MKFFTSLKFFFPIIFFIVYYLPLIILGENASIITKDVLDNELLYKYILKNNHLLFKLNQSLEFKKSFSGIPLHYFHSQFNIYNFCLLFLNTFWAYVFNDFLVRIIGFFSFKEVLIRNLNLNNFVLINLLSLSFSFIPIYSIYGITALGVPLIYLVISNVINDQFKFKDILFIILYISFSVPFTYPIILSFSLFLIFKYLLFEKVLKKTLIFFIGSFLFFVVIFKFPLILNIFIGESHRNFNLTPQFPSLNGVLFTFFKWFVFGGETHPAIIVSFPIVVSVLLSKSKKALELLFLISFLVLIKALSPFISNISNSNLLNFIIYYKIIFIVPFLLMLAFSYSVKRNSKYSYLMVLIFLALNFSRNYDFSSNVFKENFNNLIFSEEDLVKTFFHSNNKPWNTYRENSSGISYKNYISKDFFNSINQKYKFRENKDLIVTLGIHPSILVWNNFYTASGYFNNHPNDYNQEFNKIQPNKKTRLTHILSLFPSEFSNSKLKNFFYSIDVSYSQLSKMKIKYIFSDRIIDLEEDSPLIFKDHFSNRIYDIYIYEVKFNN
jgi:hypothetical protein